MKMALRFATAMTILGGVGSAYAEPVTTVKVEQGQLAGKKEGDVSAFLGIPYAAPPVGAKRWAPPAPASKWSGVRDVKALSAVCPQPLMGWNSAENQGEDCLTLNVWTAASSANEKRPVMVWIHGGAYMAGSGEPTPNGGENFAKRGVVLVSLNYRLGTLGFLAHPELTKESGTSGNYGLMDQIAALKWVKDNIAAFGGDPDNVTIFGESAGGGSVLLLTVAPEAKGLFHKAISQSGAALPAQPKGFARPDAVVTLEQAEAAGTRFAEQLKAKDINGLRALTADAIAKAQPAVGVNWPIADGKVIPDDTTKIYRAGRQHDVPLLLGWNSNEGLLFGRPGTKAEYEAGVRAQYGPLADKMLALYPAASDDDVFAANAQSFGDIGFGWVGWSTAQAQSVTGKAPVYVYHFDQPMPRPAEFPIKDAGALHADDVPYVFGSIAPDWSVADKHVSDEVQGYWVNFARTGNPNGGTLPPWQSYKAGGSVQYFQKGEAKPGVMPREDRIKALDKIIEG